MNRMNGRPRVAITTVALSVIGLLGTAGLVGCSTTGSESAAAGTGPAAVSTMDMSQHGAQRAASKQIALYTAMAHLWAQHMEWTYATVVAFAQGSPALTPSLNRLLQNQVDIGDAIKPFYGDAAGDQLTALLKEHINDAVPVLTAAKAGDSAALDTAVAAWYANANAIGDFLAAANPHWKKADMESMMQTHITQTIAYASDALAGDYDQGHRRLRRRRAAHAGDERHAQRRPDPAVPEEIPVTVTLPRGASPHGPVAGESGCAPQGNEPPRNRLMRRGG